MKCKATTSQLGMALLSWKAPDTVRNTVSTYKLAPQFLAQFDQKLIYFQEQSEADSEVARSLGFLSAGNTENQGILGGFEAALRAVECEFVLMLENDCPIVVDDMDAVAQIHSVLADMVSNHINICRLRHLRLFGEGFCDAYKYRRFYRASDDERELTKDLARGVRSVFRPLKASQMQGRSVYVDDAPEQRFPSAWQRLPSGNFLSDSWYLNWTNQSVLIRRDWCLDVLLPWVKSHPSSRRVNGFQDIEKELNCLWWRRQRLPILVAAPGIFTHKRLDR